MFRGANQVKLDAKGRLAIPTKYRQRIAEHAGGELVVTVDRDHCLLIYPMPEWEIIETKLISLPSLNKQARRLQRLMVGYASEASLDVQGRILVSKELRGFAGIEKQAMLIGQGNKFELWDEANWRERCEGWLQDDEDNSSLPTELESLSL